MALIRSYIDSMSDILPRITGTEMEWSVQTRKGANDIYEQATTKDIKLALRNKDQKLIRSEPNGMLSNGGRYYEDIGLHPEYATPEDTSFMGTVASEFAGEDIVYDSFVNAQNHNTFHDFILNKRVVDDELHTWGYHMSFSADAEKIPVTSVSLAPLGKHLSTMNIFTGAGAVIPTRNGAIYTTAQKVLNLNTDFSHSSHQTDQPLINLRNEALSDDEIYSRVHVTCLDANMSPWATWMKLGTTSIVLRMMEKGYLKNNYFKNEMHRVAIHVAHDTSLERTVTLSDGSTIRPLDIQGELVLLAEKLAKNEGISTEEYEILSEWKRVLVDLASDPEKTSDRVEWVARRKIIKDYMGRHAVSLSDPSVFRLDRSWSHIGPDTIGTMMRKRVWAKWMPAAESLKHAYLEPPMTTRALGRASLIHRYGESPDHNFTASWSFAELANTRERWYMGNPYDTGFDVKDSPIFLSPVFLSPDENCVDDDRS